MRIIFLDIDGVLNSKETLTKSSHNGIMGIDPFRVLLLHRIVEATGAKVVLSSSWRYGFYEQINKNVIPLIGKTDMEPCGNRGCEIQGFIRMDVGTDKVEKYAILDDDNDFLIEQQPNLFRTTFDEGLTEEIAKRVIKHLRGDSDHACSYPFKNLDKCKNMVCPWCHPTYCCKKCSYMVTPGKDYRCIDVDCSCGHKAKVYTGVVCRGSWALGTACGRCERCIDTKPI